ncbi:MAG: hypothetical protein IPM31_04760 [Anaerolineae bacterium]|nr:hypothetical protein [Anaerolineae bacterium]MBL8103955.1 hypothetical protein [Anaerolineales bacterium]MCC7187116.1 hypothetical protein [Anaerolineales bacterium]HQU36600.1 hypothetical protein [Anaerolineales bacterium]
MNRSLSFKLLPLIQNAAHKRGLIFGGIILSALLGFEIFNFSSTAFALRDILGDLAFGPFKWATILALAFCGIDFAGIARIFTPEKGRDEPAEVWYLLGAWLLAAAFNATLTWWGVSLAILQHNAQGGALLGQATMTKVVPALVAGMVLMIRVLLINTFSIAGERLFSLDDNPSARQSFNNRPAYRPSSEPARASNSTFPRSAPKPAPANYSQPLYNEPTYHPIGMTAQAGGNENPSYRR